MDRIGFDTELGTAAVSLVDNSLTIEKAAGTHSLKLTLAVQTPQPEKAGRLMILPTNLFAVSAGGHNDWLGSAVCHLPFTPGEVRHATLRYLLTSAQVIALEQGRSNDLNLKLEIEAVLPQAAAGLYPGAGQSTLYISVAASRWRDQLAGLGKSLAVEMAVPFPAEDDPRQEAVILLRAAQRQLGGGPEEIDAAILKVRQALEYIELHCGWNWPGFAKDRKQRAQDERWAIIRSAIDDQASGAVHADAVTKTFTYTREQAETLIAMTAALLRLVP
ncbi:hypothetical protein [Streptomyces sp. NBC_01451]|uniref:hypothetical protein n=1 Tax=Streptomyces sp. NBC_01451 TaxID=2903872 RepID=UPI002E37EE50|nr:hypothetical protein [Streptomyces sp. NBC_01451]